MYRLQDICLYITDGKHGDCQNDYDSGYYFISCKDVKDGWIDYSDVRQITLADFYDTHKRTRLEPNDILITNSGTIGRMVLIRNQPETARTTFQKSVAIIKPDQSFVIPKWLYYYLNAKKSLLAAQAGGTAQKNLLLKDLRAFEVHLPPLPTQLKIAAILSAYDDLIENNTRRIHILEEMAQAIYREWFVHFRFPGHKSHPYVASQLGEIPEGWEVKQLGEIAEDMRRNVPKGKLSEPRPFVGLEHIPRRSLALGAWEDATDLGSNKLAFKKGEVIGTIESVKAVSEIFAPVSGEVIEVNRGLAGISRRLGIPRVGSNDCHFLRREDYFAHQVLVCIQTGKTVKDPERLKYTEEHYFKSPEEMLKIFADLPEAAENTLRIAERCDFDLELSGSHLPRFAVPESETVDGYFEKVAWAGFERRRIQARGRAAEAALFPPLIAVMVGFVGTIG